MTNVQCFRKKPQEPTFRSLSDFTWFFSSTGEIYIKIPILKHVTYEAYNALDIKNGSFNFFDDDEIVIPIQDLDIIIKNN